MLCPAEEYSVPNIVKVSWITDDPLDDNINTSNKNLPEKISAFFEKSYEDFLDSINDNLCLLPEDHQTLYDSRYSGYKITPLSWALKRICNKYLKKISLNKKHIQQAFQVYLSTCEYDIPLYDLAYEYILRQKHSNINITLDPLRINFVSQEKSLTIQPKYISYPYCFSSNKQDNVIRLIQNTAPAVSKTTLNIAFSPPLQHSPELDPSQEFLLCFSKEAITRHFWAKSLAKS